MCSRSPTPLDADVTRRNPPAFSSVLGTCVRRLGSGRTGVARAVVSTETPAFPLRHSDGCVYRMRNPQIPNHGDVRVTSVVSGTV
eukprot:4325705-Prymnesium_polylepis.1